MKGARTSRIILPLETRRLPPRSAVLHTRSIQRPIARRETSRPVTPSRYSRARHPLARGHPDVLHLRRLAQELRPPALARVQPVARVCVTRSMCASCCPPRPPRRPCRPRAGADARDIRPCTRTWSTIIPESISCRPVSHQGHGVVSPRSPSVIGVTPHARIFLARSHLFLVLPHPVALSLPPSVWRVGTQIHADWATGMRWAATSARYAPQRLGAFGGSAPGGDVASNEENLREMKRSAALLGRICCHLVSNSRSTYTVVEWYVVSPIDVFHPVTAACHL